MIAVGSAAGEPYARIAYGTSQNTDQLHAGEFRIAPADGVAYALAGLSASTKFDLRNTRELPYSDEWFRVPPQAPYGHIPKLGVLHPSLMRRAQAAFEAAKARAT